MNGIPTTQILTCEHVADIVNKTALSERIYWTGVGARKTPQYVMEAQERLSEILSGDNIPLSQYNFVLRTGGADGSDFAFAEGAARENLELYLPWRGFNGINAPKTARETIHYAPTAEMIEIAKKIHPKWDALTPGGQKLHARNIGQVLGYNLNVMSSFLVCWTEDGKDSGGTRTAIVLAKSLQIPVFNLYNPNIPALPNKDVVRQIFEYVDSKIVEDGI